MRIQINNVRLSFPQLWTPKAFNEGGDESYSATFLLDKKSNAVDLAEIKKTMNAVAKAKWPSGMPSGVKVGLRDGSEKDHIDGYGADMMFIGAGKKAKDGPVPVVDRNPNVTLTVADNKIYAGCFVNAIITVWAQDNQYGKRINAQLDTVQYAGPGDAFGAPPVDPGSAFKNIEDSNSSVDASPDGGGDDADVLF